GNGKLTFIQQVCDCPKPAEAAVIAVASPSLSSGGADVREVEAAVHDVLALDPLPGAIITKSTIPPTTSSTLVARFAHSAILRQLYVHCPEFLSQGTAVADWRYPSRLVVGLWNHGLMSLLQELFQEVDGPWVVGHPTEAEVIKYASNAFLATKISFANEIANYCDRVSASIDVVVDGLQLDTRMATGFWRPGLGYGDSCLPKDVAAFVQHAASVGYPMRLLESVQAVNATQRLRPVGVAREWVREHAAQPAPSVAVLGLVYEPHSDDVRAAPSIEIVPELQQLSNDVRVWDPLLPDHRIRALFPNVTLSASPELALRGAHIVVVLAEFEQVMSLNWAAAAATLGPSAIVIDGKNCLDGGRVRCAGLEYRGVGRPPPVAGAGVSATADCLAQHADR